MDNEKIRELDNIFSELDEYERIEALRYLSRIREEGPYEVQNEYNPENYYATIPSPGSFYDYNRGFSNLSISVIEDYGNYDNDEQEEDLYKVVVHLTNIDDGCWDAFGPKESLEEAKDRFSKVLEVFKDYEKEADYPGFEKVKEDLRPCGVHLTKH